jgi:hypothetical protein
VLDRRLLNIPYPLNDVIQRNAFELAILGIRSELTEFLQSFPPPPRNPAATAAAAAALERRSLPPRGSSPSSVPHVPSVHELGGYDSAKWERAFPMDPSLEQLRLRLVQAGFVSQRALWWLRCPDPHVIVALELLSQKPALLNAVSGVCLVSLFLSLVCFCWTELTRCGSRCWNATTPRYCWWRCTIIFRLCSFFWIWMLKSTSYAYSMCVFLVRAFSDWSLLFLLLRL